MFDWLKRKRGQPKRGSRGSQPGSRRPGGGGGARETEYLPRGGAAPPPEPYPAPPQPAPEAWRPAPRVDPVPPPHPPAPGRAAPPPDGGSDKTIIVSGPGESAELVAALVGVSGVLKNKLYPVFANENHLGREGNGGVFGSDDKAISRDHGKLRCDDGKFHIRPLGDRAIAVNGERLSDDGEFLRDGDMVQMGQTTFRFKVL